VDVIHDIPEDQKQCSCGSTLDWIGEETSEQLDFIPAQLRVLRHIRPKYACKRCEGVETEGNPVKIAPPPKQIIEKSIASPSLLAFIIIAKFVDALPFYRQSKQFDRLGYELSRTNMVNWTIQLGKRLKALCERLRQEVLSGPLINMDETPIQVLKEEGRDPTTKSYMWVTCTGASENPAIYFHYHPSRASAVAQELLQSYNGVVQTDAYVGYDFIHASPDMKHAGCWAHSRRKFMEVVKLKKKARQTDAKFGHAEEALQYIRQLYAIEREADEKELTCRQRVSLRREKAQPVVDDFHQWLKSLKSKTHPKGLLGKAILYTLNQWEQLTLFLEFGFIPLDNNLAENTIRPFVVGRKNWLFCDTVAGAEASARLYSLVETARANKLNPHHYLQTLFERLPGAETEDHLKSLLPQYLKSTTSDPEKQEGVN
jgi:transposase